MARINVDSSFFGDKRLDRLAGFCEESRLTTMGRVLQVWHHCYNQKTAVLSEEDIDLQSEWTGRATFASLMVRSFLAEDLGDGHYRIRGVEDRIQYLLSASENGKKSAKVRREKYGSAQPSLFGSTEGFPKVPTENPPNSRSSSEPLDLDLDPDLDQKPVKKFQGKPRTGRGVPANTVRAGPVGPSPAYFEKLEQEGRASMASLAAVDNEPPPDPEAVKRFVAELTGRGPP